jgi:Mg2+ and Co2+ transporter CorA
MADEDVKVDVGVLKTQVLTITSLCNKMDQVIEKLVDQHDFHIRKVYEDMESRRKETDVDVKEIHDRIDTVLDKLQASEQRLTVKMEELRNCMLTHNKEEKAQLNQLLQWKWTVAGGILVLAWLLSHVTLDNIVKAFH